MTSSAPYRGSVTRDRDGTELAKEARPESPAELRHRLACIQGWVGEDYLGHPIPCPLCRPHLGQIRRRLRYALLGRRVA